MEFCKSHDKLSLDELFNYINANGLSRKDSNVSFTALNSANKVMTRVSEKYYFKDELVHFDVDGTDKALSRFVNGKIIALLSVKDFATFPPVEVYENNTWNPINWNGYLLESFVRKHSRQFRFLNAITNNSLTGAIYPRDMPFKSQNHYRELQAAVIIQENIPLHDNAIREFLSKEGFNKYLHEKIVKEIIELAQKMKRN